MTNIDAKYMKMCLTLAKRGAGRVAPNPMVGCVVLDKSGNIVSKGYHKKYGENHAERDALLKLQNNEACGGTLYVNLEPCSHYGKTPPCVDLIIAHKLARVVIGMKDVNPKVDGISKLKAAGIQVDYVLEKEATFFNRVFIKTMTKKMPYVVLKTATTMDGKIATKTGSSKWITSVASRAEVYKMRKEFDCIMTSSNTVIADNPTMKMGQCKWKCVLDKDLRTDRGSKIYSVFVECGGTLAGAMLREGLIDEVYQFVAPKILNDNSGYSCFNGDCINEISEAKNLSVYDVKQIGTDILIKSVVG